MENQSTRLEGDLRLKRRYVIITKKEPINEAETMTLSAISKALICSAVHI